MAIRSRKVAKPLSKPSEIYTKHRGTDETKERPHSETSTKFEGLRQASPTQKGPPLTLLLDFLSQPAHGERKACLAVTQRLLWQHPPNYQASRISWHNISRAMWQLNATLASPQSSKKREILSPSPFHLFPLPPFGASRLAHTS